MVLSAPIPTHFTERVWCWSWWSPSSPELPKLPSQKHHPTLPQTISQLQTKLKTVFLVTIRKEKICSFSNTNYRQAGSWKSAELLGCSGLKYTMPRDKHRELGLLLKKDIFQLSQGIMLFIFLFLRHSWKGEEKSLWHMTVRIKLRGEVARLPVLNK